MLATQSLLLPADMHFEVVLIEIRRGGVGMLALLMKGNHLLRTRK